MKKLTEIECELKERLEENQHQIKELTDKIAAFTESKENAEDAAAKAWSEGNIKEYHKAKDEIRSSADAVELLTAKLDKCNKDSLITEEESNRITSDIMENVNQDLKEKLALVFKDIEHLTSIKNSLSDEIEGCNKLLKMLQYDVCREDKLLIHKTKSWKDYSLIWFLESVEERSKDLSKGEQ